MSLEKRSVQSIFWSVLVRPFFIVLRLTRAIVLARLLPISTFGVYAGALAIIQIINFFPAFGLNEAFLYRTRETEDENLAAANSFTLRVILSIIWLIVVYIGAFLFSDRVNPWLLCTLATSNALLQLTNVNLMILRRRVYHERLAVMEFMTALLTTCIAILLAYQGFELFALLSVDLVTTLTAIVVLYFWKPVWKPRFEWTPEIIRHYISFGGRNLIAILTSRLIDKFDDLWANFYLGYVSGGLYGKAYQLATYPRLLIAIPINRVVGGTYAELASDRTRLSQAFYEVNYFLIRTSFLLGGGLLIIAPEFIVITLGAKWLPMLSAFRLMLVFTLLDPLKVTTSDLFVALGQPEILIRARFIQLFLLIAGILTFTIVVDWGIEGVALAINIMMAAGIAILYFHGRKYIDLALKKLYLIPLFALSMALIYSWLLLSSIVIENQFLFMLIKGSSFTIIYLALVLFLERKEAGALIIRIWKQLRK